MLFLLLLVEEVAGGTILGLIVHSFRANLYLNPVAIWSHDGELKCLIAGGFRVRNPVAYAVRVNAVE